MNSQKTSLRGDNGESASGVSEEQRRRIHKLIDEGMSEKFAREEVLGKGWVEP